MSLLRMPCALDASMFRLTSADFRMQVKKNGVCGIERAILLEGHSVLSAKDKDNCIGLYLDYCGSPSKLTSFEKVYARLPQLVACAITVAKRQPNHAFGCSKRRKLAAPSTDHFEVTHLITTMFLCDMYIRKDGSKACDRSSLRSMSTTGESGPFTFKSRVHPRRKTRIRCRTISNLPGNDAKLVAAMRHRA